MNVSSLCASLDDSDRRTAGPSLRTGSSRIRSRSSRELRDIEQYSRSIFTDRTKRRRRRCRRSCRRFRLSEPPEHGQVDCREQRAIRRNYAQPRGKNASRTLANIGVAVMIASVANGDTSPRACAVHRR